jgi:hypothetical protein
VLTHGLYNSLYDLAFSQRLITKTLRLCNPVRMSLWVVLVLLGICPMVTVLIAPPAAHANYAPTQKTAIPHAGQGVWYAPLQFALYAQPNTTSPKLAEVLWGSSDATLTDTLNNTTLPAKQCMVAFYPEQQLGLLAVTGDAEPNWLEVVWNQTTGLTGWVQATTQLTPGVLPPVGSYQTWTEFMMTHAKPAGIHWFYGVPESIKQLHSQADDYAKIIPAFYLQKLKVLHLRGNWMLMQGLDLEHNTPIGWMRWREETGELLLFPNLNTADNPWMQQHKRPTPKPQS